MSEYPLLDGVRTVEDLRALPQGQIPALIGEIRRFLIQEIPKTGGHLASNLGVVELTVAIHRVFDTPRDQVIWDVGHQAYVHKLLTGRRDRFATLRVPGGLAAFTRREESEFDPFGAGHSSTAISAALGFAYADREAGEGHCAVAVVGDGALTGGLAHEGINNCKGNLPLVIILNENEMSISRVTGAFPKLVSRIRISRHYRSVKRGTGEFLRALPLFGKKLYGAFRSGKNAIRNHFYRANYFEEMGLSYLGPYNGNCYDDVERALSRAKEMRGCVVVHLRTKKGYGYSPAEQHPARYHCLYPHADPTVRTFHEAAGDYLVRAGAADPKLRVITPAMARSTGLSSFGAAYPDRLYDVGIAEGHAVTFAAGLAAAGYHPYAVIYSSFLQRAYDQILHDVALQNLPVRLLIDRASLAPGDGPTHHGIFDVAFLSAMPNVRLYAPATLAALERILHDTADMPCPVAIRYPNAGESRRVRDAFYPDGTDGAASAPRLSAPLTGANAVLITYGSMAERVLFASEMLRAGGIHAPVLLLEQLTPYPDVAHRIADLIPAGVPLIFVEEGVLAGGAGVNLFSELAELRPAAPTHIIAIRDPFFVPAAPTDLYAALGLTGEDIAHSVCAFLADRESRPVALSHP